MLTPRQGLAAVSGPDGRIYAIGGSNASSTQLASAEVYVPRTDTWAPVASLPQGVRDLAAAPAIVRGISHVVAIGGHGIQLPFTSVEVYSPN
jgi:hypothetical protein